MEAVAVKDSKYDEWEVREALETLTRADEIKKDSKMMGLVEKELKNQEKSLAMAKLSINEVMKLKKEDPEKFKKWAKE